ncbi:hypothetical protein MATL_G00262720 [Megalops atlanticus]|uniref:Leucine-rich single-pass membrane protein 1 n=1 Tax=Megalops atlanticus TaxID=7932 RepID=A0A9D3PCN2_MEGAT|nr:hypothetical protein MATL_G00262720 [Megalops atlanticus]
MSGISLGSMTEIALDLDGFETERKLYTADSLNNLHKMNVCRDPKDLLSVQLLSHSNGNHSVKGESGGNQDSPRTGALSSVAQLVKGESQAGSVEEEGSKSRCPSSKLLSVVFIILVVALVTSLVLSSYAVHLMVQATEKMNEFSSSNLEQKYLEEIRQWKALILQHLDESTGEQEQ